MAVHLKERITRMAQTIRLNVVSAQLDTYGALQQGEMGFCTDTKEILLEMVQQIL